MKKRILYFLIIVFLFVTVVISCKKNNTPPPDNPYGLPDATQTGRNMLACRINGKNWISDPGINSITRGFRKDTMYAY